MYQEEINNRWKLCEQFSKTETHAQRMSRLFGSLQKQWINTEGKIWSLRTYLMTYNKDEYKRILLGIRLNKGLAENNTFFTQLNDFKGTDAENLNIGYGFRDLKLDKSTTFDGRIPK